MDAAREAIAAVFRARVLVVAAGGFALCAHTLAAHTRFTQIATRFAVGGGDAARDAGAAVVGAGVVVVALGRGSHTDGLVAHIAGGAGVAVVARGPILGLVHAAQGVAAQVGGAVVAVVAYRHGTLANVVLAGVAAGAEALVIAGRAVGKGERVALTRVGIAHHFDAGRIGVGWERTGHHGVGIQLTRGGERIGRTHQGPVAQVVVVEGDAVRVHCALTPHVGTLARALGALIVGGAVIAVVARHVDGIFGLTAGGRLARVHRAGIVVIADHRGSKTAGGLAGVLGRAGVAVVARAAGGGRVFTPTGGVARIGGAGVVVVAIQHIARLAGAVRTHVVARAGVLVVAADRVVVMGARAGLAIARVDGARVVVVAPTVRACLTHAVAAHIAQGAEIPVFAGGAAERLLDAAQLAVAAVQGAGLVVVAAHKGANAHTLLAGGIGRTLVVVVAFGAIGGRLGPAIARFGITGGLQARIVTRALDLAPLAFALVAQIAHGAGVAVVAGRADGRIDAAFRRGAQIHRAVVAVVTGHVVATALAAGARGVFGTQVIVFAGRAVVGHHQDTPAGFQAAFAHSARPATGAGDGGAHARAGVGALPVLCAGIGVVTGGADLLTIAGIGDGVARGGFSPTGYGQHEDAQGSEATHQRTQRHPTRTAPCDRTPGYNSIGLGAR